MPAAGFVTSFAGGCSVLNPLPKASAFLANAVPRTAVSASYRGAA